MFGGSKKELEKTKLKEVKSSFLGGGRVSLPSMIKGKSTILLTIGFMRSKRMAAAAARRGHISWNNCHDGAWRQLAIIQGEALEPSEMPVEKLSAGNHPGRLRLQSFRPGHREPLTDALIGQGMMSLGGGGYGGGGLPFPSEVLQIWGGEIRQAPVPVAAAPTVVGDDGSGEHAYALIAIGPQGHRAMASPATKSKGLARLRWDSTPGADAYIIVRDGKEVTEPLRLEGSQKEWTDKASR